MLRKKSVQYDSEPRRGKGVVETLLKIYVPLFSVKRRAVKFLAGDRQSRLKCPALALNGRLAKSFPKYPTTALPNAPGR